MVEVEKLVALLQSGALDEKSLVVVPRRDLRIEVPQSFFRDVGLIEAVKEAQASRVHDTERLQRFADKILSAVRDASQDVYETRFWQLRYLKAAEYMRLRHHDLLRREVNQDTADQQVIWAFEVVEVTGPAVVRLERGHYVIQSLREELIKLMRQMESK